MTIFGHLGLRNPWTDWAEIWHNDDDDDDDEIAYFTVRWKTRASFFYRTKNVR